MDNAADDPVIIDTRLAASVGWQMRCKPRELIILPEMISIHCRSPFDDLESENARFVNPVYGSALFMDCFSSSTSISNRPQSAALQSDELL